MKFNKIRKAIEQAGLDQIRKHYDYIEKLTVSKAKSDWFAETFLTPKSKADLESCELTEALPIRISEQMKAKAERIEKSLMNKRLDKVAAAEAVELPEEITITVNWVKSQTWGHNPHATVYAANTTTTGRASGGGYDKRSFAIAKAFNDNPEVMAIIYAAVEAGVKPGDSVLDSVGLPFFDGGCGVECFYKVFANCGYQFKKTADGRTFDCYSIEKKED